jgi:hypothetical protein
MIKVSLDYPVVDKHVLDKAQSSTAHPGQIILPLFHLFKAIHIQLSICCCGTAPRTASSCGPPLGG